MGKHTVIRDELKITGSGVYSFSPYQEFDKHGWSVFKIGISLNINKRIDGYHTSFPMGLWITDILHNIPLQRQTRNSPKVSERKHLEEIERFIFEELIARGGKAIYSTTRFRDANQSGQGRTEWIYCDPDDLADVFLLAHDMWKGKLLKSTLNQQDMRRNKRENMKKPHFIGKIITNFFD